VFVNNTAKSPLTLKAALVQQNAALTARLTQLEAAAHQAIVANR
jgi:hypothetical protein